MRYIPRCLFSVIVIQFLAFYSANITARESINLWFAGGELENVLHTLSEQFAEQSRGIHVNVVNLPNEELKTSIVRTVRNNLGPDIAVFTSDNTAYGPMMKLSSFEATQLEPYWEPSELESMAFNNRIHGLPFQRDNRLLLFYNKTLIKQPADNWDTILAQTPALLRQNILPLGVMFEEPYWFAHFATHFSVNFIRDDQPVLNTLEMAESLKFFKQLVQAKVIDEKCGYDCVSEDFYQGKVAYALNGVWALNDADAALGDNLGITRLPSYDGRAMKALASIVMLTFPNDSWNGPNQKAVRAFARFLRTEQAQLQIAAATNMLPINLKWLSADNQAKLHKAQLELRDELEYMPATLSYISMWNGIKKGVILHSNGQLSALDAGQFMQKVTIENQQRLLEMDTLQ